VKTFKFQLLLRNVCIKKKENIGRYTKLPRVSNEDSLKTECSNDMAHSIGEVNSANEARILESRRSVKDTFIALLQSK
jgi:hypothetical protein